MTNARYRERAGNASKTRSEHFSGPGQGKSRRGPFSPRLCDCGCGAKFTPTREWQRFKNTAHRKAAWKQGRKDSQIPEILKRLRAIEAKLGLNKKGR